MEADWSVALGVGDPVITVPWAAAKDEGGGCKFIDLRIDPQAIDEIEEVKKRPALRAALLSLNSNSSPLWTAKCDVWTISVAGGDEPYDPYEMDATPDETACGSGCYIDLLARDRALFAGFEHQERWMRQVTDRLRTIPARAARIDLVLRPAHADALPGFAVTWFVEGCGATPQSAEQRWRDALHISLALLTGLNDTITTTGE
jgi:hypothetical protein